MQATKAKGQQARHAIPEQMNSIVILELYSSRVYIPFSTTVGYDEQQFR